MTIQNSLEDKNSLNDEVDLMDIISILWQGKKLIASFTLFAAIISVVVSLMLTSMYRSESVLQVRDSQDSLNLSQFSGLASMAGLSLPGGGGDSSVEIIATIKSREFVKHLITFDEVLPSLTAAKSYDPKSGILSFNKNIYDTESKRWIQNPNSPNSKPSYIDAHRIFIGMMSISKDMKTGLISISIEHISPIFAKDLLDLVIKEANNLMRQKDITFSERALIYLNKELSKTLISPVKDSINTLIEGQLETKMMANIHDEYTLVKIEPPFIPENRFFPVRSIISILGTLFGIFLGVFLVLTKHYTQKRKYKTA